METVRRLVHNLACAIFVVSITTALWTSGSEVFAKTGGDDGGTTPIIKCQPNNCPAACTGSCPTGETGGNIAPCQSCTGGGALGGCKCQATAGN
jgi:hypothetical protein